MEMEQSELEYLMIDFAIVIKVILAVFIYMNLLFFLAVGLKKNDIVDVAWGMGFILCTIMLLFLVPHYHWRKILVSTMVIVWGLRLALHIFYRNRGTKEDFRYAKWRKDWGKHWILRSYLQVFILQGFFMLTIAYPLFLYGKSETQTFNWLDLIGVLAWVKGFFFESVGDYQLSSFKKDPANKGKIMDHGLWRFTRHPNYYGEALMWWGIFIITLNTSMGWIAIFSPLIITGLLVKVSGVPLLEKKYEANPDYRDYVRKTSSFIPWLPKK